MFINSKSEATLSVVRGLSFLARVVKTIANKSPPDARKRASTSKKVINTLSGMAGSGYQIMSTSEMNGEMPPGRGASVDKERENSTQRISNGNGIVSDQHKAKDAGN